MDDPTANMVIEHVPIITRKGKPSKIKIATSDAEGMHRAMDFIKMLEEAGFYERYRWA